MKWLHISDLHYDPQNAIFDTKQLLSNLNEYIKSHRISVNAIFYTGDFRYAKNQEATFENAQLAAQKLKEIARNVGIPDEHIHIVPGNHDMERGSINLLEQAYKMYKNGEFAGNIEHEGNQQNSADYLSGRFRFFSWVASELNNQIWLNTPADAPVYHRSDTIEGSYNIVYLNTSLGCGQDGERTKLRIGYEYIDKTLSKLNEKLPTIVLGHHGLNCFERIEQERIKSIFRQRNVKLYLCGDEHVGGINKFGGTLQLTAGCLKAEDNVEPTFYIGDMDINGSFVITAYQYSGGTYPGWSKHESMTDKINEHTNSMFPRLEQDIFGRSEDIRKIVDFLKPAKGKIAEVWGAAGVGKTTVCNEVLNNLYSENEHVFVDARIYSTAMEIQRYILRQLGLDVEKANINPEDYAGILLSKTKSARKILYLDNAEMPIIKDKDSFAAWLLRFARESGWRVMYSTQIQLDSNNIEPFHIRPLDEENAREMFISRRYKEEGNKELSKSEKQLVHDIAVTLLSRHPLAIVIATSSNNNKKYSLVELKDALKQRVKLVFEDDLNDPHRSMSAALSLTVSGIENSKVSKQAKVIWSMIAQYPGEFSDELFSLVFGKDAEYTDARFELRKYDLISNYTMPEPIKAEAPSFVNQQEKKTSRSLLFRALLTLFDRGLDRHSPDRQKWHDMSLSCLHPTLLLLAESEHDDFEMIRPVVHSALHYFQFSSYASLQTLQKLVQYYRDERDNLGLANVLKSMGDLESRIGEIDAAISKYSVALGLYDREQEPMGRIYCLAKLCRAYAEKKDEPHSLEYAKAVAEALGSVSENVAAYAVSCVREAMSIFIDSTSAKV